MISWVSLNNFRPFDQRDFHFHPKCNILVGSNGTGKTSVLEAIYSTVYGSGLYAGKLADMVRRDTQGFSVKLGIQYKSVLIEVQREVKLPRTNRLTINGKSSSYDDIEQLHLSIITIANSDLSALDGQPAQRRELLDRCVFSLKPGFAKHIQRYKKALDARNRLLKEMTIDLSELEEFTKICIDTGKIIRKERQLMVEDLSLLIEKFFQGILGEKRDLELRYEVNDQTEISFERERAIGTTLWGPHRDRLGVYLDGRDLCTGASQGQKRAALIAIKSILALRAREHGKHVSLFLDDFSNEIDDEKRINALSLILESSQQIFITTTSVEGLNFQGFSDHKLFELNPVI